MQTQRSRSRQVSWAAVRSWSIAAALFVTPPIAIAQSSEGAISGRVRSARTGAYLEGATVEVAGSGGRTITSRGGSFTIQNVPSGNRSLQVFYTGMEPKALEVNVGAGTTIDVNVALTDADIYTLDKVTVSGQREGAAASITRQRNADNLMQVVSMDSYGNVADGNIATFMQNLTGAAATKETGEYVGIGLRGTPPELNPVNVDGAQIATGIAGSAGSLGDRAALLDQVPSEFIKEVEVSKANRPDQWADSLGGQINLVTKSAFDFHDRVITYRVGARWNSYRGSDIRATPIGSFTAMDTFGPKRQIGVTVSGSYVEMVDIRDQLDDRNNQSRLLNDIPRRIRSSLGAKVEFRPDSSMRIFLQGFYNRFTTDLDRINYQISVPAAARVPANYSVVSRAAIEAGAVPRTTTNAVAGFAPGQTNSFVELLNATFLNQVAREVRRSSNTKIGVGFEKKWQDSSLLLNASHNPSIYNDIFHGFSATLNGGFGLSIDRAPRPDRHVFRQTYGPDIYMNSDLTRYTSQLFQQYSRTLEQMSVASLDYSTTFRRLPAPLTLKAGAAWRRQHRWGYRNNAPTWDYIGADGVVGRNAATGINDDNIAQFLENRPGYAMFKGDYAYQPHQFFDYGRIKTTFERSPNLFRPVGTTVSAPNPVGVIDEEVSAGYIMGKSKLGPVEVTTGVRQEETKVDATGTLADAQNPTQGTISRSGKYRTTFPSVHLRYEPVRSYIVRAIWATSSGRPAISSIVPNTSVNYSTQIVTQNNPALKPQYGNSYDISLEHYFEPAGVISVGYFAKDIKDFIATNTVLISSGQDNGFDGRYGGFNLVTAQNLSTAEIKGVEIDYRQQLRMLPRPFKGTSIFANYTELKTSGTYANGAGQLQGFVPRTWNAGVIYDYARFEIRATYHFKSHYLRTFSTTPASVANQYDDPTVDLQVSYKWKPYCTFYLDVINVFNKYASWYDVDPHRVNLVDIYGTRLTAGVSGRF